MKQVAAVPLAVGMTATIVMAEAREAERVAATTEAEAQVALGALVVEKVAAV